MSGVTSSTSIKTPTGPLPKTAGGQSDADFVKGLYQELLGREADPAGLAAHLDAIQKGASRYDIRQAIASSDEFKARQAQQMEGDSNAISGQGTDSMALDENAALPWDNQVQSLDDAITQAYQEYHGREPSDAERHYCERVFKKEENVNFQDVIDRFERDEKNKATFEQGGIPQYFDKSCGAVEAMAAWKERDPAGYQSAMDELYETGSCTLPNGDMVYADQELAGMARKAVPPDASKEELKVSMMQHVLMAQVDSSWRIGGNTKGEFEASLDQDEFTKLNEKVGNTAFVPGDDPAGQQAEFDALMQQSGQVQVALQTQNGTHAVTVTQKDGQYFVEMGNSPLVDDSGNPVGLSWEQLSGALASGDQLGDIGHLFTQTGFFFAAPPPPAGGGGLDEAPPEELLEEEPLPG